MEVFLYVLMSVNCNGKCEILLFAIFPMLQLPVIYSAKVNSACSLAHFVVEESNFATPIAVPPSIPCPV